MFCRPRNIYSFCLLNCTNSWVFAHEYLADMRYACWMISMMKLIVSWIDVSNHDEIRSALFADLELWILYTFVLYFNEFDLKFSCKFSRRCKFWYLKFFQRYDFFNDVLSEIFEQVFSTWYVLNHASMWKLQKRTNRNSII